MNYLNPDGSGLVGGLLPSGKGEALQLDASGNLKVTNIPGPGSQFIVTSGLLATSVNNNLLVCPISLFNPANSGKTLRVYSIQFAGNAQVFAAFGIDANSLYLDTTDPAGGAGFTRTLTPSDLRTSGATSAASVSGSANNLSTAVAPSGTQIEVFTVPGGNSGTTLELLTNGAVIEANTKRANRNTGTFDFPTGLRKKRLQTLLLSDRLSLLEQSSLAA